MKPDAKRRAHRLFRKLVRAVSEMEEAGFWVCSENGVGPRNIKPAARCDVLVRQVPRATIRLRSSP